MPNNLRRLRKARSWTQDEAASALGTTRNQYAKLEHGTRRLHDRWIDAAAQAFGVDPGEVVRGETPDSLPAKLVGSVDAAWAVTWTGGEPVEGADRLVLRSDGAIFGLLLPPPLIIFRHERRRLEEGDTGLALIGLQGDAAILRRIMQVSGERPSLIGPSSIERTTTSEWVSPVVGFAF